MNPSYQQFYERLKQAERVFVVTHLHPDGDAIGALGFMIQWLEVLGKRYTAYTAGPLPHNFSYVPGYFSMVTDADRFALSDYDLIISVDCANLARTALAPLISARRSDQFYIEIDHHPSHEKVSNLAIREEGAASTTEILYHIAQQVGLRLTQPMARCLLTGILTDTGNFMFPTTSQRTIAAASDMLLGGASLAKIVGYTERNKTLADLKLWGMAMARLTFRADYGIAYTVLTPEDFEASGADEGAIAGLAEFICSLPEVGVILVLRDDGEGNLRGNFRTMRHDIDVSRLARRLGGGGHHKAAGFSVRGRLARTATGWRVEM